MTSIILIIFIILFTITSAYLLGRTTLVIFKLPFSFCLSLIWGTALFILASYLLNVLQVPSLLALLIGLALAHYLGTRGWIQDLRNIHTSHDRTALILLFTLSLLFAAFNWRSGITTTAGFEMRGTNAVDGFVHLAYAHSLVNSFPPMRPTLGGELLRGYHYFFSLFIAQLYQLTGLPISDLIFRVAPFFIALLYGAAVYFLVTQITTQKRIHHFAILAAYTSYSSLSLLPWLHLDYPGNQNPLSLVHNPAALLSISFLLLSIALIPKVSLSWRWSIIVGSLVGMIAQTKVYAGVIALALLSGYVFVYLLLQLVRFRLHLIYKKSVWWLLIALALAGGITYLTFYQNNSGAGSLVWAPFLYFDHFMEQRGLIDWHWPQRKEIFLTYQNVPRLILLYLEAIALFLFVHLGTRIVLFSQLPNLFRRTFWSNQYHLLLSGGIAISFLIGTFFIQSLSVFDIAQFFWTGTALLSLPSAFGLYTIWQFLRNRISKVILVALFIVPFSVAYAQEAQVYLFNQPTLTIPTSQLAVMQHIRQSISTTQTMLFIPLSDSSAQPQWDPQPTIPALTGRSVYLAFSGTPFPQSSEVKHRIGHLQELIVASKNCDQSRIRETTHHLEIPFIVTAMPNSCLREMSELSQSMESETFSFYVISAQDH